MSAYDSYGRVTEVSSGESTIRYTYDRYGELAEKRYENGQGIICGYDSNGIVDGPGRPGAVVSAYGVQCGYRE